MAWAAEEKVGAQEGPKVVAELAAEARVVAAKAVAAMAAVVRSVEGAPVAALVADWVLRTRRRGLATERGR